MDRQVQQIPQREVRGTRPFSITSQKDKTPESCSISGVRWLPEGRSGIELHFRAQARSAAPDYRPGIPAPWRVPVASAEAACAPFQENREVAQGAVSGAAALGYAIESGFQGVPWRGLSTGGQGNAVSDPGLSMSSAKVGTITLKTDAAASTDSRFLLNTYVDAPCRT